MPYQPGTVCRGSSARLAPEQGCCGCPGRCPARVPRPRGPQDLGHLAVGGDLSSSLMAEGLGEELALGTGCSFWESDGSSFLRFTAGSQWLAPPGVPSLSLLS